MIKKIIEVFRIIVESRREGEVKPYDHQIKTFEAFEKLVNGEKDVVVLIAPCGSGKTEATIVPFLAQYAINEISIPKLIYVTPTQTLLYNTRRRLSNYVNILTSRGLLHSEYLGKLEPDVEHGLDIDPSYLIPRIVVSTYDVLVYAWMARRTIPKRPFTTRGTIVSSLIVFDEAHLIQDLYMYSQRVFPKLIATMAELGVPIIIVSATLSNKVIDSIREDLGGERIEIIESNDQNIDMGTISVEVEDNEEINLKKALETIVNQVSDAIRFGKDVLIVLDTVKVATAVFEEVLKSLNKKYGDKVAMVNNASEAKALIDQGKTILVCFVHGRLSIGVRKAREEVFEVLKFLRRSGKKNWNFIVIATQVAEVGIDYSFDLIITEIAPPTATIQRLMRGGRNKNQEATGIILPPIITEVKNDIHPPSYLVYSKELLVYSLDWVNKKLKGKKEELRSKLISTKFLEAVADEEYQVVSQREDEWVKGLVDEAIKTINASKYFPPLATAIHRRLCEEFKLRLGEYIVLHMVRQDTQYDMVPDKLSALQNNLRNYLIKLKPVAIIDESTRLEVAIRKDVKKKNYHAKLPEIAIWNINKEIAVIPYIVSLKTMEIDFIRLTYSENVWRPWNDVENIFAKIVLARPIPNYCKNIGLVEVNYVDILMRRR